MHPIWSEHYDYDERDEMIGWGVDPQWLASELDRVDTQDESTCSMPQMFRNFDLTVFWKASAYARKEYVAEPLTVDLVKSIEAELGYKLPAAYIKLMKTQNGGLPRNTCHRTLEPTSWAHDHVAITGLFGISRKKDYSLCGNLGSQFWIKEWGYPAIGVYFADCPSAGHDMICLDYRKNGPKGEPQVVHVDQECDYQITPVAETFEKFVSGLEDEDAFE